MMVYCVAKAGLNMAMKVFALELGPNKIRVNSVKTKMFEKNMGEAVINRYNSMIPIGCINDAEHVVQCVL